MVRTFSLLAMLARHYGAAARTKRISRPYAPLVLCQYSLPYWSGERMTSFYPLWELFRNARARYEDPDWEHICADYCISEKKTFFLNEEIVDRKIAGLGVQMFSTVLCTTSLSSNLQKQTLAATLYFTACVSWGYPQGGDGGRNCQALEERRCGSQDPVCKCAVQGLSYD